MKICVMMVFGGVLVWHTPWKNLCEGCWDICASLGSVMTEVVLATV